MPMAPKNSPDLEIFGRDLDWLDLATLDVRFDHLRCLFGSADGLGLALRTRAGRGETAARDDAQKK